MFESLDVCYSHNLNRDKDKFASRSRKCIFVGYPFDRKDGDFMTWKSVNILFSVI